MSLLVEIGRYASGVALPPAYKLKVDTLSHSMTRAPTQSGLPGDSDNKDVNIFGLDLGICIEQIAITGIVEEANAASGEPTKDELEEVVRNWWISDVNTKEDFPENANYIIISTGRKFWGMYQSCNFRKMGGIEDRWEYDISFLVITNTND